MSTLDESQPVSTDVDRPSTIAYTPRIVALVGIAAFLTTFGQPGQIGGIALQFLIVKHMHSGATKLASFLFFSAAAWYFKPLAGLVLDSVPLFGTRRRSYLIGASAISAVAWMIFGHASTSYHRLLDAAVGLNVFMMIASTVMGALLVEYGQHKAATGGLSSVREAVQDIGGILVGVIGGYLATLPFSRVGDVGAALMVLLCVSTVLLLAESPTAHADTAVWTRAGRQIRTLFTSSRYSARRL